MNATTTTTTPSNPMGFRTLQARFAGICRRCNGAIAVGDTIRYGGKGKTYHMATDCAAPSKATAAPAPQLQAQPAPTAPPTGAQLMTAALAATLQQTWTGLLAMPARLGDVEPRVVEAAAPAAAAAEAEVQPDPTPAAPLVTAPAQKAPRTRQTARQKANVHAAVSAPLTADDLF